MNTPEYLLKKYFGHDAFRSSQREIISHVLGGGNCLVMMPTGMGKSLCYQIPSMIFDGLTIVISPLVSLMKDQSDSLCEKGIDSAYINSSLTKDERLRRYENIRSGKYNIIYVSPERFRKRDFLEALSCRKISLLALDEAHCVSQWGSDFRPDYSRVGQFRRHIGNPVTIALSASATADVQKDVIRQARLDDCNFRVFNEGICRPNLSLSVEEVIGESEKFEMIYEKLVSAEGSRIVYFTLIKSIDRFAEFLDGKKMRYMIYHGRLPRAERSRVQTKFMDSRSCVILATNAFGMGIDKPDIRMIVHSEIPDSVESYYQEIGRAGRDGKPSRCVLYYSQDDLAVQIDFLQWKNPDQAFIRNAYSVMKNMDGSLVSCTYDDLQERLVYKNRGDHRLQTVLSIFDRFGVTSGSIENQTLRITGEVDFGVLSEDSIHEKMQRDRKRLVDMMNYAKTESCRREYLHKYFASRMDSCGSCDNCLNRESF